jgi:hypothetical protein
MDVSSNGSHPGDDHGAPDAQPPLESLRRRPENVHLFRGYGPLVVGVILFLLMVTLAPTVAPERVVERPVDDPAVTTTSTTPPTTTAAP